MTALLLARSFPPAIGGIETYASELFRRFSEKVLVVAPNLPGAASFDAAYPHEVKRYWYPWSTSSGKLPLATLAATALPAAITNRIDLVISEQVQTAAVGVPLATALGVPHIVFAYGMELSPLRMRRMKQWGFSSSAKVIAISRFARDTVQQTYGIPPARLAIVAPGIDPKRFALAACVARWPARPVGPTLLTLGRLDPTQRYKGYDRVIRLTAALVKDFPGVRLLIAGSGPDREWLEGVAQSLNVADRVHFRGYVPDDALPNLFAEADLFVLASGDTESTEMRVEGYGIVLAEAAAAGIPSVAYRAGGVVDVIEDDETGLLVEPSESHLLDATRGLLHDHARRASLGRAAVERANTQLGWSTSVATLTSTIADVRRQSSLSRAS